MDEQRTPEELAEQAGREYRELLKRCAAERAEIKAVQERRWKAEAEAATSSAAKRGTV